MCVCVYFHSQLWSTIIRSRGRPCPSEGLTIQIWLCDFWFIPLFWIILILFQYRLLTTNCPLYSVKCPEYNSAFSVVRRVHKRSKPSGSLHWHWMEFVWTVAGQGFVSTVALLQHRTYNSDYSPVLSMLFTLWFLLSAGSTKKTNQGGISRDPGIQDPSQRSHGNHNLFHLWNQQKASTDSGWSLYELLQDRDLYQLLLFYNTEHTTVTILQYSACFLHCSVYSINITVCS